MKKIKVGTRVRVLSYKDTEEKLTGTYLGNCWFKNKKRYMGPRHLPTGVSPLIKLDDGSFIWGIDCWWLPLDQALAAEARFS